MSAQPEALWLAEVFESFRTSSHKTESGQFLHLATAAELRRLHALNVDMLKALRRASLALAFAAETSPAMRDDYEAVSAAIAGATQAGAGSATP